MQEKIEEIEKDKGGGEGREGKQKKLEGGGDRQKEEE